MKTKNKYTEDQNEFESKKKKIKTEHNKTNNIDQVLTKEDSLSSGEDNITRNTNLTTSSDLDIGESSLSGSFEEKVQLESKHSSDSGMNIFEAAKSGDIFAIKEFLESGGNINTVDEHGWSILHNTVSGGHSNVVELLINLGADVNIHNKEVEITPLYLAVLEENPNEEIINLLLKSGADLLILTDYGNTALHSITGDHPNIVKLILDYCKEKNIDILNIQNNANLTPMQCAIDRNHPKIVKTLLNGGAEISLTDLYSAAEEGNYKVIDVLKDYIDIYKTDEDNRNLLDYAYDGIEYREDYDFSIIDYLEGIGVKHVGDI